MMPEGARKSGTEINQNVNPYTVERLKRSRVEEVDPVEPGAVLYCALSSAHLEKVPEIPRLRSE
jgi:hypothetical protein